MSRTGARIAARIWRSGDCWDLLPLWEESVPDDGDPEPRAVESWCYDLGTLLADGQPRSRHAIYVELTGLPPDRYSRLDDALRRLIERGEVEFCEEPRAVTLFRARDTEELIE